MGADRSGRWLLDDANATMSLGAALARTCPPANDAARVLFLSGELGAGKTTLAAAMLAAVGVSEPVRSPSYALVETYVIDWGQAVHVDCFRLTDSQELELLGLRDHDVPHTLWLVEWPERALDALPTPDLWVRLEVAGSARHAELTSKSAAGALWLERLLKFLPYVANTA